MMKDHGINFFRLYLSMHHTLDEGFIPNIIKSLMNTSIYYKDNGLLPYTGYLYGQETDSRASTICLNILNILITREHEIANTMNWSSNKVYRIVYESIRDRLLDSSKQPPDGMNIYSIDYISKYIKEYDTAYYLTMWIDGLYKNIRNPYDSENTILPGSMKKVNVISQ